MNTIRTTTVRNTIAAVAVALLGSVAATSVSAQELSRAEVRSQVIVAQGEGSLGSVANSYGYDDQGRFLAGSGQASRSEVKAAAAQAVTDGEIEAAMGNSYGFDVPVATGETSRAEVKAATVRALRDGTIAAQMGNAYDSRMLPRRAARSL